MTGEQLASKSGLVAAIHRLRQRAHPAATIDNNVRYHLVKIGKMRSEAVHLLPYIACSSTATRCESNNSPCSLQAVAGAHRIHNISHKRSFQKTSNPSSLQAVVGGLQLALAAQHALAADLHNCRQKAFVGAKCFVVVNSAGARRRSMPSKPFAADPHHCRAKAFRGAMAALRASKQSPRTPLRLTSTTAGRLGKATRTVTVGSTRFQPCNRAKSNKQACKLNMSHLGWARAPTCRRARAAAFVSANSQTHQPVS